MGISKPGTAIAIWLFKECKVEMAAALDSTETLYLEVLEKGAESPKIGRLGLDTHRLVAAWKISRCFGHGQAREREDAFW